jgi:hypothetical protein
MSSRARLCGPFIACCERNAQHRPDSHLELAYHRADKAIEKIVDLLAAARLLAIAMRRSKRRCGRVDGRSDAMPAGRV